MISYFPLGDSALQLTFGDSINEHTHNQINAFMLSLNANPVTGIVELVPAYTQLVIHYNPLQTDILSLVAELRLLEEHQTPTNQPPLKLVEIPVLYGSPFGFDLETVSKHTGLSEKSLIEKHSAADYRVYMLGFTPGFCYLGGMDPKLATPRKTKPSTKIQAGSVGIAGEQTGIYPIESPGGWQIIGRTPIKLFNPSLENPFLLEAGNLVRFYPISEEVFHQLNQYDA